MAGEKKYSTQAIAVATVVALMGGAGASALINHFIQKPNQDSDTTSIFDDATFSGCSVVTYDDGSKDIVRIVATCDLGNNQYHVFSLVSEHCIVPVPCDRRQVLGKDCLHRDIIAWEEIFSYMTEDEKLEVIEKGGKISAELMARIIERICPSTIKEATSTSGDIERGKRRIRKRPPKYLKTDVAMSNYWKNRVR